jgi:hypothetical protein
VPQSKRSGAVRKADAGAGRVLHDGGSARTGVAGFGCCCARRCWTATRSMRVMGGVPRLVAAADRAGVGCNTNPTDGHVTARSAVRPGQALLRRCSPDPATAEQQHQHNDQHDQTNTAKPPPP